MMDKKSTKKLKIYGAMFFVYALLIVGAFKLGLLDQDSSVEFQKEEHSEDDLMDMIRKKMQENSFYSTQFGYTSDSFESIYTELIRDFLDHYYIYMSDEQIATLLYFVDSVFPNLDYEEKTRNSIKAVAEEQWNEFLSSIFPEEEEFGYGFCKAFALSSNVDSSINYRERNSGASKHFTLLCDMVGYESLLPLLFKGDMEQVVELICQETYINEEEARHFIQLFDEYFKMLPYCNENGASLSEPFLVDIKLSITSIIQAKCENDPYFKKDVMGRVLQDSEYFKKDGVSIQTHYLINSFTFQTDLEEYGRSSITLPYYYLHSDFSMESLLDSAAFFIIQDGYQSSIAYDGGMSFVSYLMDWEQVSYIANSNLLDYQKKKAIYQSVETYFDTEDQFNAFLVALNDSNVKAIEKFFQIWKSRMMTGPVTIQKLLEFNSLKSMILSSYSVYNDDYLKYKDTQYIEKGSKEDLAIKYYVQEPYFMNSYDYMKEFDEVMNYFHQEGSVYTELLSDGYNVRDYRTGEREFYDEQDMTVLSKPLSLQQKDLGNGHTIYYYVKPKEYPSGEFVYAFTNILNCRVSSPASGISTTLENETTGEMEDVLIVSLDEEASSREVYFQGNYFELFPHEKVQMKEFKEDSRY